MAYLRNSISNIICAFMIFVLVFSSTHARSGCALFGHSCYGGIGKRTELTNTNNEDAGKFLEGLQYYISRPIRVSPEQYERMKKYIDDWIYNYMRMQEEDLRKE